jgi:putative copper export protein
VGVVGALSWRLWVLPTRDEPARPDRCRRGWPRIRLTLFAAIAGLTITTPLLLLLRAAEMGRQTLFGAVPLVPRVLAASHYGSVWKVRAAAVVVLWLWVFWRGTGKGPAAVMLVAMLAIGWTYSASGHASAWGDFSLAQLIDGLHVASTAVWVGGLLVLATSARPLFLTGHDRAYALETAERLSRLAGLALLCVVPTGIYNAVTQIGFLSALWETAYGRLLLLKLAGVLGMVGLGAINRYRGLPALRDWAQGSLISHHTPSGGVRFLRIATVESLLAVWVLGCTALLSGASPPRPGSPGATHHAAAAEVSTALVEIAAHYRGAICRRRFTGAASMGEALDRGAAARA